ncbi:helicase-associated domain-containing protein [uncultured Corynebacterium sp.]|uniref:helicase-associated domain-containing protein n=1 Tax=uncultured Corynebacterium sp. TaxID=159447 RepID=UPI0025FA4792|nr:helicase-associated domain-containing protein [uncultured Corynebacterium sp.]
MSSPGSVPDHLSEWLAQISDDQLSLILRERLENLFPMPIGSGQLAARLTSPFTVTQAVEALDMLSSACLEVMADLTDHGRNNGPLTVSDLYDHLTTSLAQIDVDESSLPTEHHILSALEYLSEHGLVWGLPFPNTADHATVESQFRVVPDAVRSLTAQIAFIEPPLPTGEDWTALLDTVTRQERRVLQRLHDAGGRGVHSPAKNSDPSAPVPHLISLGLLEVYDTVKSSGDRPSSARNARTPSGTQQPPDDVYVRLPLRVHNYLAGRHDNFVPTSLRPPEGFHFPPSPIPIQQTPKDIIGTVSTARAQVSSAAAAQVSLTLFHMRELLRFAARTPFKALSNSEIGVRELRRAERELSDIGLSRTRLITLLELARDLGFLDWGDPESLYDEADYGWWGPTRLAEEWIHADSGTQWALLAMGWFGSLAQTWVVGKDDDGKNINVFDDETVSPGALILRRHLLSAARGFDPSVTGKKEDVYSAYGYMYPQHVVYMDPRAVPNMVANAEALGLISGRATTGVTDILLPLFRDISPDRETHSTPMADYVLRLSRTYASQPTSVKSNEDTRGSQPDTTDSSTKDLSLYDAYVVALIQHCKASFPAPSSTLIAQGDMTVLAPSPLDDTTTSMMDRIADVESPGLATLYRVSENSLRRGMASGLTPEDISSFLSLRVLNGVPQSLTFLINDVGRFYGSVRGGEASCYLRIDDPQVVDDVLSSPAASSAGLRKIAPTVLVGSVPLATALRDVAAEGFQVVQEDAGGMAVQSDSVARFDSHFDISPADESEMLTRYSVNVTPTPEGGIAGAIAAVRRDDADDVEGRVLTHQQDWVPQLSHYARSGMQVIVTYVEKNGATKRYRMEPLTVTSGYFDGFDVHSSEVRRIAFHHVTSITLLDQ